MKWTRRPVLLPVKSRCSLHKSPTKPVTHWKKIMPNDIDYTHSTLDFLIHKEFGAQTNCRAYLWQPFAPNFLLWGSRTPGILKSWWIKEMQIKENFDFPSILVTYVSRSAAVSYIFEWMHELMIPNLKIIKLINVMKMIQ